MDSQFDRSAYNDWKKNPITLRLLELIAENDGIIKDSMLRVELIVSENSTRTLPYYAGLREGFARVLNLEYEDLLDEEREEDEATSEALRGSSFS